MRRRSGEEAGRTAEETTQPDSVSFRLSLSLWRALSLKVKEGVYEERRTKGKRRGFL